MLYPTIDQLTKEEFNRYELALATARCARKLTDEYVEKREAAEKSATGNKKADRNVINALNKEYREEKAVKNAITKIHKGDFKIIRAEECEEADRQTEEAEEATEEAEAVEETAEENA